MPVKKGAKIAPAQGKLGVLLVGLGAVSTTFIAGVEAIKDGLAELKEYRGVSLIRMLPSGDARIINHLLIADWQNKMWKYALPADQRLKME